MVACGYVGQGLVFALDEEGCPVGVAVKRFGQVVLSVFEVDGSRGTGLLLAGVHAERAGCSAGCWARRAGCGGG
jgi:hypothetical protein